MSAPLIALTALLSSPQSPPAACERITLASEFLCEGAGFADLDRDGHQDVVSGPYWYRGPVWTERREIRGPIGFDPAG
jgi:hypothetical protein